MYKYCVASVSVSLKSTTVTYYAFHEGAYGLHLVSSWKDEDVLWYDTEKEALGHRWNGNDCVLMMCAEYIPQFSGIPGRYPAPEDSAVRLPDDPGSVGGEAGKGLTTLSAVGTILT